MHYLAAGWRITYLIENQFYVNMLTLEFSAYRFNPMKRVQNKYLIYNHKLSRRHGPLSSNMMLHVARSFTHVPARMYHAHAQILITFALKCDFCVIRGMRPHPRQRPCPHVVHWGKKSPKWSDAF